MASRMLVRASSRVSHWEWQPGQIQATHRPLWMVEQLDLEATRLGVTRQSIIKVWLAERLAHRTESNLGTATVH